MSHALGVRTLLLSWLAFGCMLGCASSRATSARTPSRRASPAPTSAAPAIASTAPPASRPKRTASKSSKPASPPPGCTLPATLAVPPSYSATLFRGGRLVQTEWRLEKDGTIESFPSEIDDFATHAAKGRRVVLKSAQAPSVSSEPRGAAPPRVHSVPGARYPLSGSPRRCSLTLPGEAPRIVEMQWYDFTGPRFALLWPLPRAGWVLVLHEDLFSPAGPWLAPAIGDIDGDGRSDLAFVAQGVDECQSRPSDCPEFWVNVIMSATDTSSVPTLVSLATQASLLHELGLPTDVDGAVKLPQSRRWHSRIRRGAFEVTVSGPKARHTWTAVLRAGKLTLEGGLGRR